MADPDRSTRQFDKQRDAQPDGQQDEPLEPGVVRFIERMGIYYQRLGVPRIGGRILGLLMMARRPLTLDDMASLLRVSRASVSTNARMNVVLGMVRHVSLPGDRRDFYVFSPNAWEERLAIGKPTAVLLRNIGQEGLAALAPTNREGRERLVEMIEFCIFLEAETEGMMVRWREHLARLRIKHEHAPDAPFAASTSMAPHAAPDSEMERAEYDGHD